MSAVCVRRGALPRQPPILCSLGGLYCERSADSAYTSSDSIFPRQHIIMRTAVAVQFFAVRNRHGQYSRRLDNLEFSSPYDLIILPYERLFDSAYFTLASIATSQR